MPTSSVGRASSFGGRAPRPAPDAPVRPFRLPKPIGVSPRAGVSLIEMIIVVTLLSLMVGISFPAISSGVETLRLNSAADDVVGMLTGAVNRADRRQHPIEVTVSREPSFVMLRSPEPGFERVIRFPETISIVAVLPVMPYDDPRGKRFLVHPGGAPPRIGIVLANRKGDRRLITLDPITGVADVRKATAQDTQ